MQLFITCAPKLENILHRELQSLGFADAKAGRSGVSVRTDLPGAYRICCFSRVAHRVLMPIGTVDARDADSYYSELCQIDWGAHLRPELTFAIDVTGRAEAFNNTQFAVMKAKDAIVDSLRRRFGNRPSIDKGEPDVRFSVHLRGRSAQIAVDIWGESLHRRNYRVAPTEAPLRETLAAALLLASGWEEAADKGLPLLDPMCGSGTFLIEGALIAGHIAPALIRTRKTTNGWLGHDPSAWSEILAGAEAVRKSRFDSLILGFDSDDQAVSAAKANAEAAGVSQHVFVEPREISQAAPDPDESPGLLVCNPPYGERLDSPSIPGLYRALGQVLRARFPAWQVGVLSPTEETSRALGLRWRGAHPVKNGPIDCDWLRLDLTSLAPPETPEHSEEVRGLINRIQKREKHLRKWARRNEISCYRVYDADIPQFAWAVDRYGEWLHLQEYAPPKTVDEADAQARRAAAAVAIPEALGVDPGKVFLKTRNRQRGQNQYQKRAEVGTRLKVQEGGHAFWVNLTDYTDTGLFLDHRLTRQWVQSQAKGTRFLNLFCYTGSVTVYAAKGGARSTVSVDLSKTYLDWAGDNLRLNGFGPTNHELVQADCLTWLAEDNARYDLIFLDPPTFSNSKKTDRDFEVQRDHLELLELCVPRLAPGGQILFSNNRRDFTLDNDGVGRLGLTAESLDSWLLPEDFKRSPNIHHVWRVVHKL
ncbi:MAG: bifunctional 23S rRNA (guanine(2069)-N(7))-methyltransferase RlmK/23S rRNA (guanine(2445)-N(2))-methyltransferase RlmL [Myxococcales bacterium]|nr:bifunctional 23S rRNA (guanine(2069)-N(7))-methyltransferase RlmK/23S rRNA (guanine(2445)-N(2))-methyltransferase RlmL [Myxococcales bacterium]